MTINNNHLAFLALLKAGLWEEEVQLSQFGELDFEFIHRLAQEQSVVGLITAGLEHVIDVDIPRKVALTFASSVMQIETRNIAMNNFIAELFGKMNGSGIHALLIKGQGIAQCYSRPLWRAAGDVDLLLDSDNFEKASLLLTPMAKKTEDVRPQTKHYALTIGQWEVELHGTLRSLLTKRIDRVIDEVQNDTFINKKNRLWYNGENSVLLPSPNNDVIFVFVHILQHYFRWGIGLRQICDWCRLLYTYKSIIDSQLLEERLSRMGIKTEWYAFAYLAVNTLGMPSQSMSLYSSDKKWEIKSNRILSFVFYVGNFGQNRDYSYYIKYPYLVHKAISLWRHSCDSLKHLFVFPLDTLKMWGKW